MHGLGSSVEETNQWKMRNHGSYLARIKSYHLQGLKHTSDVRQQLRVLSVRGCQIQTSQGEATALNEWPQKDTGQVEETAKAVQILASPWPASMRAANESVRLSPPRLHSHRPNIHRSSIDSNLVALPGVVERRCMMMWPLGH